MRRILLLTLALFIASIGAFAQVGQGAMKGTVTEKGNGLPIPFANVILKQGGAQITGAQTNFDGEFDIRPLPAGKYDVEISYLGFGSIRIPGVTVNSNQTRTIPSENLQLSSKIEELGIVDVIWQEPLIRQDAASTSTTIDAEAIGKMPIRSAGELAATVGGTYSKDNGNGDLNIRGGRDDANYYYIDGIKVRGSSGIPPSAIGSIDVITGGLPVQYGDVTGGVISITTKGVSSKYAGGLEVLTSGVKLGDNRYVGLDQFGYNLIEGSLSGPLLMKLDSTSGKKEPILGFFISGNISNQLDGRPSAVGAWKVKDDVLDELKANPLRQGFTANSVIPNSDYLRLNDFERVAARPNVAQTAVSLAGKLDVITSSSTNLTFGGSLTYSNGPQYEYNHSLFDYENYPIRTNLDWRVFGRYTQRFSETMKEGSSSLIKNAYYSIQADYSREFDKLQSADHGDNFFDYGYLGKFKTYQYIDTAQGVDGKTGITGWIQQTFVDTLITFEPGDANPELAAFTQRYYELNGWEGFDAEGNPVYDANQVAAFTNYNNIQSGGGMINGDNLDSRGRNVYGIWSYNSDITNDRDGSTDRYFESISNQIRLSAQGAAQIGDHNIVLGFEYEQRIDKSYSLSPRTLWTIARLRSNTHVSELDTNNPKINYPGPTITYPRLNSSPGDYAGETGLDNQSFIDYNLRKVTGLNPDGNDFLDVFAIDKDLFNLNYFSADELYNSGNSLVSYYGYDPYSNRSNSNPSFDDFFTATNEFGNYTRPIGAFQPIYVAGFIEDKFEFDDLIFRIGVRVDRFDANQQVLKDPYVLFPTIKAGEDEAMALLPENGTRPSNIGDDYVVYVDNVETPTAILGYRSGKTWYSAEGAELQDASSLRVSNGLPAPLLVDKVNTNSTDITSESFEDYKPQTNFMPRIAFSFPISDEANFFAHYDVLTKRPTTGIRLDPSDYYYLQSRASSAQLNNPSLQPEKTIDYEVGFQQLLTQEMSLKFSAFYRESRNMVQAVRVFDAYPIEYRTYENIDFSTVKGLTVTYELRSTKNLTMRASYTLQFAEGTGSNSTSQLNLARSGQGNLRAPIRLSYDQRHQFVASMDYRYGSGEKYNGPIVGENFRLLESMGFNLQLRGGSGEPYNPQSNFTSAAMFQNNPASLQQGRINGASLPWKFRFDFSVDRDFKIVTKGDENGNGKKKYTANVYIQVKNLLNARNINNVWRATGNPDDDGYLNSALGIQRTEEQNSPYSYLDYYQMKLWDPQNWELPRRIRLGLRFNF